MTARERRAAKAYELFKTGKTVFEIAIIMGTTSDTVKKYIDLVTDKEYVPRKYPTPRQQGAIFESEIDECKQRYHLGDTVRMSNGVMAKVIGLYTNFVRTDHGCIIWPDVIMAEKAAE